MDPFVDFVADPQCVIICTLVFGFALFFAGRKAGTSATTT